MADQGQEPGSGAGDAQFLGSIPDTYERLMVPMIFAAPAELLAAAVAERAPASVLETAAGTGVLTRAMRRMLPGAAITATDLNQPMLDEAARRSGLADVTWQQADATALPFDDGSFDVVACQFGVMFFPDKVRGFSEARRVLRPGGAFVFNTWDRIENNEVPHVITRALVAAAPDEPLVFMSRTPHGYFDVDRVRSDLAAAGMTVSIRAHEDVSRTTAAEAAVAFCQGTPLRGEIERHPTLDLASATRIAAEALLAHYGPDPVAPPIRWFQVVAAPG
jgi:SAM-dependent methyltransferase